LRSPREIRCGTLVPTGSARLSYYTYSRQPEPGMLLVHRVQSIRRYLYPHQQTPSAPFDSHIRKKCYSKERAGPKPIEMKRRISPTAMALHTVVRVAGINRRSLSQSLYTYYARDFVSLNALRCIRGIRSAIKFGYHRPRGREGSARSIVEPQSRMPSLRDDNVKDYDNDKSKGLLSSLESSS